MVANDDDRPMQIVLLKTPTAARPGVWPAQEAVAGMITAIGEPHFGDTVLAQLNRWMPFCWWSVYTVFEQAPPHLHAHGSFGVPDHTLDSWRVYRKSLYRHDQTFAAARDVVTQKNNALMHWDAREIPSRHRAQIYSRHSLRERVSIVANSDHEGLLAINLYRHDQQDAMTVEALEAVGQMAQPLLACVQRHLSLPLADLAPTRAPLEGLTRREKEVCERLLKGWTHEGIAADLSLTAATVKTYRDRAFDRLGIRYRHELFALMAR
jgi:DNA-binding CsgD family transcriptional regulator